ncbi:hypothetical protein L6Q79_13215 [bacterium]|nr:hypothetical protein [bacterium]NUN46649.1 hypothetical protein [bacterium]
MNKTYRGIWYRDHPQLKMNFEEAFKRDKGKLRIEHGQISFIGKKNKIEISNLIALHLGLQGTDPVNCFIKVTYKSGDSVKTCYFADGKLFGYWGAFGGTYRLFKAISIIMPRNATVTANYSFVYTQIILFLILLFMVFKILYL